MIRGWLMNNHWCATLSTVSFEWVSYVQVYTASIFHLAVNRVVFSSQCTTVGLDFDYTVIFGSYFSLPSPSKGSVIYDPDFDLFNEIAHLCRLCKAISANAQLVKPGGAQCLPSGENTNRLKHNKYGIGGITDFRMCSYWKVISYWAVRVTLLSIDPHHPIRSVIIFRYRTGLWSFIPYTMMQRHSIKNWVLIWKRSWHDYYNLSYTEILMQAVSIKKPTLV